MKKVILFFILGLAFIVNVQFKEKDPLNKRFYETKLTEVKEGQSNVKPHSDEMEFKDGKVFSKILNEKHLYKWLKYTINLDSTYIDSKQNEVSYYEVEVNYDDDKNQRVRIFCKINNADISGEIKISKKDKVKKEFTFIGKEKAKK